MPVLDASNPGHTPICSLRIVPQFLFIEIYQPTNVSKRILKRKCKRGR